MAKPKHTPGPWYWVRSDDCNDDDEPGRLDDEHGIVLSAIESRTRHAYSQGNPIVECDPANAQLIASAPALLEALELLVELREEDQEPFDSYIKRVRPRYESETGDLFAKLLTHDDRYEWELRFGEWRNEKYASARDAIKQARGEN